MLFRLVLITLVSVLSVQADYLYKTNLKKGAVLAGDMILAYKGKIPDNQCDGGLYYPHDYKCSSSSGGEYAPLALRVEVQDNTGPAMVRVDRGLSGVRAYRVTDPHYRCNGAAIIAIYLAC